MNEHKQRIREAAAGENIVYLSDDSLFVKSAAKDIDFSSADREIVKVITLVGAPPLEQLDEEWSRRPLLFSLKQELLAIAEEVEEASDA